MFYLKGIRYILNGKIKVSQGLNMLKLKNDIFSEGISLELGKIKIVEFGVVKGSILKKIRDQTRGVIRRF